MSEDSGIRRLRGALLRRLGSAEIVLLVSHMQSQAGYIVSISKSVVVPYEKVTLEALEDEEFLDGILKELYGIPEDVQ